MRSCKFLRGGAGVKRNNLDNLFSIASCDESKIQRTRGFRLGPFLFLDARPQFALFYGTLTSAGFFDPACRQAGHSFDSGSSRRLGYSVGFSIDEEVGFGVEAIDNQQT